MLSTKTHQKDAICNKNIVYLRIRFRAIKRVAMPPAFGVLGSEILGFVFGVGAVAEVVLQNNGGGDGIDRLFALLTAHVV